VKEKFCEETPSEARIEWNPIDAATQPPTGTRERVLNLSDPRTDHRHLGFGPSLAVVMTAGYIGFLAGPPLIGFVAQLSTIRSALWILVVLTGLSAFASISMKGTSPLRKIL
jgi:hypothetical protein